MAVQLSTSVLLTPSSASPPARRTAARNPEKWGVTTSFSAELAPQGIRVNLVCPGFIDTPMHHRARGIVGDDLYDKVLIPRVHTRRAGRPDEIAQTIVFLCSDEASSPWCK